MASYKLCVLINPFDGRDAEFNAWYDAQHVPDVLALPGFQRAQRYTLDPVAEEPRRYLTIYDVEADTAAEVAERVRTGQSTFRDSDTVDKSTALIVVATPMGPPVESQKP